MNDGLTTGWPNPSGKTKFSGAKGDRENIISHCVQGRIVNLTRLIHTLLQQLPTILYT